MHNILIDTKTRNIRGKHWLQKPLKTLMYILEMDSNFPKFTWFPYGQRGRLGCDAGWSFKAPWK